MEITFLERFAAWRERRIKERKERAKERIKEREERIKEREERDKACEIWARADKSETKSVFLGPNTSGLRYPGTTGFRVNAYTALAVHEEYDAFWLELYAALLEGYQLSLWFTILANVAVENEPEHWEDDHNYRVKAIKRHLLSEKLDLQWCERPEIEYGKKHGKNKNTQNRELLILSNVIDPKLIEINYRYCSSECWQETWFCGYAKEQGVSLEQLADPDLEEPVAAITMTNSLILIREEYYPVSQLVERIRSVAKKYNKELKVLS